MTVLAIVIMKNSVADEFSSSRSSFSTMRIPVIPGKISPDEPMFLNELPENGYSTMAINTLLLALTDREDTEKLVEMAIDIADPGVTTVVVGTAYEDETHASVGKDLNISSPNELAERDSDVEAVVSRLKEAGIKTEIRGSIGAGGQPYVQMAEQFETDMIVLQGMTRSPTGKAVFGSVPQEILLNAPCPVTFIRR